MEQVEQYRERLAARVVREIKERCGGLPDTIEEMECCIGSFGGRVAWIDPDILPYPILRNGVVLMPDRRDKAKGQLFRWLAHELAEVVLNWDGTREYRGPGWTLDRHRIAGLVERVLCPQ